MVYALLVGRIADFVQGRDQLLKSVLLQANAHFEQMILRRGRVEFPAARNFDPSVLEGNIVPSFAGQRLGTTETGKGHDESR
jgi:hypothetical protein